MGPGGDTGDHHALQHAVGFSFHHGAVHERAGVALVAVADHIFDLFLLAQHLRPFPPGGEAAAPSAAQTGIGDLIHDLLRGHVKQRLFHGGVAANRDVFPDGLGVDMAAVFQSHAGLFLIKRDILLSGVGFQRLILIDQALHDFIL